MIKLYYITTNATINAPMEQSWFLMNVYLVILNVTDATTILANVLTVVKIVTDIIMNVFLNVPIKHM